MQTNRKPPKGHLVVQDWGGGRRWIAVHNNTPDSKKTRKTLGPAWVKPSNKRTARGAIVWRTADGPKPDGYMTPAEAEHALSELLHARMEQRATKTAGTFGDACDRYLVIAERDREASTFRGYRGIVRTHLEPQIGRETSLKAITTARVDKLREDLLNAGKAPRTVQQVQVILHGILKRAVKDGLIESNPAENADKVKLIRSQDFNMLEPAEVEAVARAAEKLDAGALYAALIRTAAYTGLRAGELRALRWEDVRFADAHLIVRRNAPTSAPVGAGEKRPKSGKRRTVPLIPQAMATLEALSRRELFTGPEDRVFPAPLGGPFNDQLVRDTFYAAIDAAGLGRLRDKDDPITFHDLRHTFGSLAVRVAEVPKVQMWMGHANIATTMIYVHAKPQHDDAARLAAAFALEANPLAVDQPAPMPDLTA